jgi:Ca-activated chloride channel family protein
MEAAKKVVQDFAKERKYDRTGLVIFSVLDFTQCPLATYKDSLAEFINNINVGNPELDGVAIGSAIMTFFDRLKDSQSRSRIIILVTDGNNNMGEIDPLTASEIIPKLQYKNLCRRSRKS